MYSSTLPALSSLSSLVGGAIPFACVSLSPHRAHAGLVTCRRDPHPLGLYLSCLHVLAELLHSAGKQVRLSM